MIEIQGIEELERKLVKLADKQKFHEALNKSSLLVEGEAKKRAPKDTGALRRSITSEVNDDEGVVFSPLEYAPYVEFGTGLFATMGGRSNVPWTYKDDRGEWHKTSGMHPQPFLIPALEENKDKILQIFQTEVFKDD